MEYCTDHITLVIPCVNYADMLKHTLPLNNRKDLFSKVIVITRESDKDTIKVCEDNGITPVLTDEWDIPGDPIPERDIVTEKPVVFNKGKALNVVLNKLKGWICLIDADIIIPAEIMNQFKRRPRPRNMLYGTHRVDCPNPEALEQYKSTGKVGSDWQRVRTACGVGYFQLFHRRSTVLGPEVYPTNYSYAGGCDTYFRRLFDGRIVNLLFPVIHLFHGNHKENWCGRTTPVIW